jgi:hypothetical protein
MARIAPRDARVGDLLSSSVIPRRGARRLEATAVLLPGSGSTRGYRSELDSHAQAFAEWDGRVLVLDPDGAASHRLLVVDRYGQVYAVHEAADAMDLPPAGALHEWFRFLATACPECGVLDEAVLTGPTP